MNTAEETINLDKYIVDLIELEKKLREITEINDEPKVNQNELRRELEEKQKIQCEKELELKEVESKIRQSRIELKRLQKLEEAARQKQKAVEAAINNSHDKILIENTNEAIYTTSQIEHHLGFKLKLVQMDESNDHLWNANFFFDVDEKESKKSIKIRVNTQNLTYELCDMKPKPAHFTEMAAFLADTNDLTGFMCTARKFFKQNTESIK